MGELPESFEVYKRITGETRIMKYSTEKIYHFQCDCGKWFSIADLEEMGTTIHTVITCPHCGISQAIGSMEILQNNLRK